MSDQPSEYPEEIKRYLSNFDHTKAIVKRDGHYSLVELSDTDDSSNFYFISESIIGLSFHLNDCGFDVEIHIDTEGRQGDIMFNCNNNYGQLFIDKNAEERLSKYLKNHYYRLKNLDLDFYFKLLDEFINTGLLIEQANANIGLRLKSQIDSIIRST